eukprot:scaffold3653_cov131-Skeletonema_dohrnii-CCMP3373.AAC.1
MLSPFSSLEAYGGAIFSPRLPSHIFPSEEDRAAAMDDAPYDDMEEQYDGDDSDDDGSPNDAGGFLPRVKDWKDVDYGKRPLVTVDRARRDVFNQYIKEHKFIRNMFDHIDKNRQGSDNSIDKIVSILYGTRSPVFEVFQNQLSLPYDQFCWSYPMPVEESDRED